mmetsp:Transcript_6579/g.14432  ORF Transcript_6579/g.14432 Transcript_6579/m.14432 type:complete len:82 (+) Transcript_6579:1005-1250(+)
MIDLRVLPKALTTPFLAMSMDLLVDSNSSPSFITIQYPSLWHCRRNRGIIPSIRLCTACTTWKAASSTDKNGTKLKFDTRC